MAANAGSRSKDEKEEELKFLKQEEKYLLDLIATVDGQINTLEVDSMTIKREMSKLPVVSK